jgi:antitoxin YefM
LRYPTGMASANRSTAHRCSGPDYSHLMTCIQVYTWPMEIRSLSDLKSHLSEYADRAELEHEQFTITRNGRPAVVMVSADEWESLQETLFWLSQPGIHESLAEAEDDIAAGRIYTEAEVRQSLGLPEKA